MRFGFSIQFAAALLTAALLRITFLAGDPSPYATPHDARAYPASPVPDRIVLSWSDDPSTTMTVSWRTDSTVARALAQLVPAPDGPPIFLGDVLDHDDEFGPRAPQPDPHPAVTTPVRWQGVTDHYHRVHFTDLEPDTPYLYRVGDGTTWSPWLTFRTAPRQGPLTFLYLGDAQNNIHEHFSRTLRAAILHAPHARFMTHAGDLVLSSGNDYTWGEWFAAGEWALAMIPQLPAPGNSDHVRLPGRTPDRRLLFPQWRAAFGTPANGPEGLEGLAYTLDVQDLRLVVLYSNFESMEPGREILVAPDRTLTDAMVAAQRDWLERVLRENDRRWTVVVFHHPVFTAREDRPNERLEALFRPLFARYGVDLVLQGHDHVYARGRDPGLAVPEGHVGPIYVISNAGGKMRPLYRDAAWIDRAGEYVQLFHPITVSGDTLTFEAYTPTGRLYDAFRLVKTDGPNRFEDLAPDLPEVRFAAPLP